MTLSENTVVAVVGLGYVGLPLAVEFGKKYRTFGYDLSEAKIANYKNYCDPTGSAWRGEAVLTLTPRRVKLGDGITFTLQLRSNSARVQKLAVDYAVHHVKADGSRTPKVFKGWTIELPARGEATLVKRHSLRPVTPRRYHPGEHGLVVQVNGRPVAESTFALVMPRPTRAR